MSNDVKQLLEKHFEEIESSVLSKQNPITGLLPASTAINAHGDYTDAWVRDNVYSILCVWGLGLAYKKYAPDDYRSYLLSQSVVKLMRGLLVSMMRQAQKVEKFKYTLNPLDALHAKYGTSTGLPVVGDNEWGHLQLDATSLYLLTLTQMIGSGLRIIYTIDEVNFVQNLVHYISRTYCTADYGIWERGHKINTGTPEINCSSVGMAKAALEAIDGFNLFGNYVGKEAIIHVVPSDIGRSRFTLKELLPRESGSKETDAALLSIIGYPAYAVEDLELVKKTKNKILDKLAGNYGCKRFLLDGHQSSIEDSSRLHYEKSELREFENIESEWPLFFTYLLLDALMREDKEDAQSWLDKLKPLFVEKDGKQLLPELYYVPNEFIEAERNNPKSQKRVPNDNLPLVWAQSLYFLSSMILDGVLSINDIDPLNRRKRLGHVRNTYPLVPILCENEIVKQKLINKGFNVQTLVEVQPLKIVHASELSCVHKILGKNEKLGLTGRPAWVPRSITTARLHILAGEYIVFLPYYFNPKGFYFCYDNTLLVEHFKSSLKFLAIHWDQAGQPIIPFLVREDMLEEGQDEDVVKLLYELQSETCNSIPIKTASIEQLLTTAGVERIDNLHGYKLEDFNLGKEKRAVYSSTFLGCEVKYKNSFIDYQKYDFLSDEELSSFLKSEITLMEKTYILELLANKYGLEYKVKENEKEISLYTIASQYYENASYCHDWAILRKVSDILNFVDERLEDALLEIVIRQKRLAVGRAYSEDAILSNTLDNHSILDLINRFCGKNSAEKALTQEILLHLGHLIRSEPELFEGMLTLRTWYIVQLLVSQVCKERKVSIAQGYEYLITLAPNEIYKKLKEVLEFFSSNVGNMIQQENLYASGISNINRVFASDDIEDKEIENWALWRRDAGMISKLPTTFYADVWYLLQQCTGLVIGDKYNQNNRIGSDLTLDTTAGERNFDLRIDSLLQSIEATDYRQLNFEVLQTLSRIFKENPDIKLETDLLMDVLIGHAVRIAWEETESNMENYDEDKGKAWAYFYSLSPKKVDEYFVEAFMYLLTLNEEK